MQRQLATSHSIPRRNPMMTPTKSKLCNPGELKKPRQSRYFLFLLPLALAACSSMPSGPNVMVLPGKGVSFEQFRADDLLCRQYAASQTGTNSNDAAINSGVKSAAVGTALGAAGGALIDGGHGAAVGAGVGLVFGGLTGAGSGTTSSYQAQLRYDNAYVFKGQQHSRYDELLKRKYTECSPATAGLWTTSQYADTTPSPIYRSGPIIRQKRRLFFSRLFICFQSDLFS